jgi:hypothetical protein
MKSVTVDEVLAMKPCSDYTRERVEQLWSGRGALSVVEILDLDIPAEDRLWAVLREEVLGTELYRAFGHACADRAVERHALHCGIPKVEQWAARWLSGEDRTEDSAWNAWSCAWSCARDAALGCATATWAATGAAHEASAVASAAGATELEWQVQKLKELLR